MYADSIQTEHWYFFAVTGINITQKLLNTFNNAKDQVYKIDLDGPILDHFQAICQERQDTEQLFNINMHKLMTHLYFNIFTIFNREWVD